MRLPRAGKHRKPWYRRGEKKPQQTSARREAQKDLRQRKRTVAFRRFFRKVGIVVVAAALAVGVAAGGYFLITREGDPIETPIPPPLAEAQVDDRINTTLVFGTEEKEGDDHAVWLTLLSIDGTSDRASVIYIPAHTATEVPGRGLMGIGESLGSGGVPLLLVTAENLLGVQIDRYLELSDSDSRILFEATGAITVDVPVEVHIAAGQNETRLLFSVGEQLLPANFLEKLLFTIGAEGDESELGSRHLAFWDGLFDQFAERPKDLAKAIEDAGAALSESDAPIEDVARFFQLFGQAPTEERILTTLPVSQVSVGGDELYEVDTDTLADFMEQTLGSKPSLGKEVRVQILNGNGEPGIGLDVAEKLSGENFRVLLSGNARTLDYEKTLIVTYDQSEKGIAIAELAQSLLGVGEVQVSAQGQGIVDLTIVVGEDFLRTD